MACMSMYIQPTGREGTYEYGNDLEGVPAPTACAAVSDEYMYAGWEVVE